VEPRLKDFDGGTQNAVHQSVCLRDTSTPNIAPEVAQGLRLADPLVWGAAGGLDQLENPLRNLTVVFDPVLQILQGFALKLDDPAP
jgi:hypothetical protein